MHLRKRAKHQMTAINIVYLLKSCALINEKTWVNIFRIKIDGTQKFSRAFRTVPTSYGKCMSNKLNLHNCLAKFSRVHSNCQPSPANNQLDLKMNVPLANLTIQKNVLSPYQLSQFLGPAVNMIQKSKLIQTLKTLQVHVGKGTEIER